VDAYFGGAEQAAENMQLEASLQALEMDCDNEGPGKSQHYAHDTATHGPPIRLHSPRLTKFGWFVTLCLS